MLGAQSQNSMLGLCLTSLRSPDRNRLPSDDGGYGILDRLFKIKPVILLAISILIYALALR